MVDGSLDEIIGPPSSTGDTVLYITLSETRRELLAVAHSHGWSLDGIHIHEMEPLEESLAPTSR